MNTNDANWLVLCVRARHEKKVQTRLKNKELSVFLPTVINERRWSDRKKLLEQPLFPCYIFLNVKSRNDLFESLMVPGVRYCLKFGKEFAKVTDDEINKLKMLTNDRSLNDLEISNWSPKIGQKRRINYGPLSGLECEVTKVNNRNKILVRIQSLRQDLIATIPYHYLTDLSVAIK